MAAAPTLEIAATVDILAAGTDSTVTPLSSSIKPTVAGGQAFDLTAYPNLRAVQIHAINGSQAMTEWSTGTAPEALAADTPDGACLAGQMLVPYPVVLKAQFRDATLSASYGINAFDAAAFAAPSTSYALNTVFAIGDGALKDYFLTNWTVLPCAVTGANEQPAATDQRQTLYVPSGTQSMFFGILDGDFSDNSGSAIVSLMLTIGDVSGSVPAGTGGTAVNVLDTPATTIDGDKPVLGSTTATVSQSTVDPDGNTVSWPTGITLDTATGDIQVATGTAPGSYQVWFQLCDATTSPASCALARATVTVRAASSAQSVPTLGEMALLLLAALLGVSAVALNRRGR